MFNSAYPTFHDFIEYIDHHPERGMFQAALAEYGWPSFHQNTFLPQPGAACNAQEYQNWFAAVRSRNAAKDGTQ